MGWQNVNKFPYYRFPSAISYRGQYGEYVFVGIHFTKTRGRAELLSIKNVLGNRFTHYYAHAVEYTEEMPAEQCEIYQGLGFLVINYRLFTLLGRMVRKQRPSIIKTSINPFDAVIYS